MEAQVGEGPTRASQLARCPFGNIEEIAIAQEMLLAVDLQKALTLQHHTSYIDLGIDM